MDRQLILRVMVPMGALSVLLLIVAVIVVLAGGKGDGGFSLTTEPKPEVPPPEAGDVPYQGMDTSRKFDKFPLDDPNWKFIDEARFPGLKYLDATEGTGDVVQPGVTVDVYYTGWRLDGMKFDSTENRKAATFGLNGVIQGWTHGIPGMKVGGTRRLYIPSQLAYGQRGSLPKIRPNDDLVFEIQMLGTR